MQLEVKNNGIHCHSKCMFLSTNKYNNKTAVCLLFNDTLRPKDDTKFTGEWQICLRCQIISNGR